MIGAALLAKKAVEAGLSRKPWVKTTLAPGSQVVTDHYEKSGLMPYLRSSASTSSATAAPPASATRAAAHRGERRRSTMWTWPAAAVLSGNRNFEGRINPDVKMNYLASPPWWSPTPCSGAWTSTSSTNRWESAGRPAGVICATSGRRRRGVGGDRQWPSTMTCSPAATPTCSPAIRPGRICPPRPATFAWDADSTYVRKPRTSTV